MTPHFDIALVIGRFQPFHNGHLSLVQKGLELAPLCVVALGTAHQARTSKNPFTWQERAEMVRMAVPMEDAQRLRCVPLRDYYNESRWVQSVQAAIAQIAQEAGLTAPKVALVGHLKDASSYYLRCFPGWHLIPAPPVPYLAATAVRNTFFAQAQQAIEPTLAALCSQVPASTVNFLRAWATLPFLQTLAQEWQHLQEHVQSWSSAPYPVVFVTVDVVVRCAGHVLLIQRGGFPGKGLWATPGGFLDQDETLYQGALRELQEETHLDLSGHLMQHRFLDVAVFDHPQRSLRGRTITHAHYFDLGERDLPEIHADDDAQAAQWVSISALSAMEDQFHDDHFHILDHFLHLTER